MHDQLQHAAIVQIRERARSIVLQRMAARRQCAANEHQQEARKRRKKVHHARPASPDHSEDTEDSGSDAAPDLDLMVAASNAYRRLRHNGYDSYTTVSLLNLCLIAS